MFEIIIETHCSSGACPTPTPIYMILLYKELFRESLWEHKRRVKKAGTTDLFPIVSCGPQKKVLMMMMSGCM
jgi:hypothetical protein